MPRYVPPTLMKRASDDLTYQFNFERWGFLATDAIASAVVTGDPSGLTIGSPTIVTGGLKVNVVISGGTAGVTYTVTCVATTTAGRDVVGDAYLEMVSP